MKTLAGIGNNALAMFVAVLVNGSEAGYDLGGHWGASGFGVALPRQRSLQISTMASSVLDARFWIDSIPSGRIQEIPQK